MVVCRSESHSFYLFILHNHIYINILVFCVLFSITLLYNNLILDFKESFEESELLKEPSSEFTEVNHSSFKEIYLKNKYWIIIYSNIKIF